MHAFKEVPWADPQIDRSAFTCLCQKGLSFQSGNFKTMYPSCNLRIAKLFQKVKNVIFDMRRRFSILRIQALSPWQSFESVRSTLSLFSFWLVVAEIRAVKKVVPWESIVRDLSTESSSDTCSSFVCELSLQLRWKPHKNPEYTKFGPSLHHENRPAIISTSESLNIFAQPCTN